MSPTVPFLPPLVGLLRDVAVTTVTSLSEPVTAGSRRNAMRAMTSGLAQAQARAEAARALEEHRVRNDPGPARPWPGVAERR